jgi:hypothetical protein
MSTYIFYHIFCNDKTLPIVTDQINKIVFSQLYKKVDTIYCFLVGLPEYIDSVKTLIENSGKKFIIGDIGINDKTFESFTVRKIKNYIQPGDKLLYIHSKGVGHTNPPHIKTVTAWRTFMEYFLISNYEECIKDLDTYDLVGVNLQHQPFLHYSGHFWWSTGAYFLKLSSMHELGTGRWDPEQYICKANPNAKTYHNSNVDMYGNEYSLKMFIDQ